MSIISRIFKLITGLFDKSVSDAEAAHPEIAFDNMIKDLTEKHAKVKMAAGALYARRTELTEKGKKCKRELASLESELGLAVDSGQDDLAITLLQRKEFLDANVRDLFGDEDLVGMISQAEDDCAAAKTSLEEIKAQIVALDQEKSLAVARWNDAKARLSIQESLDGVAVEGDAKVLADVRKRISQIVGAAELGRELGESDLNQRLAKLRKATGPAQAKAKLEEMKRARAQNIQNHKELKDLISRSPAGVAEEKEKVQEVEEVSR